MAVRLFIDRPGRGEDVHGVPDGVPRVISSVPVDDIAMGPGMPSPHRNGTTTSTVATRCSRSVSSRGPSAFEAQSMTPASAALLAESGRAREQPPASSSCGSPASDPSLSESSPYGSRTRHEVCHAELRTAGSVAAPARAIHLGAWRDTERVAARRNCRHPPGLIRPLGGSFARGLEPVPPSW
jgi:hypothetical protein